MSHQDRFLRWGMVIVTLLVVLSSLAPFLWFVAASFRTPVEITAIPPRLIPSFSIDAYRSAIGGHDLIAYLHNSFLVAGSTTVVSVAISILAGYALARLGLPHSRKVLMLLLLVSMFPQISIAGPVWRILQQLGWLNTYHGLVIPYVTLTLPLGVWILTTFFEQLPPDLEDAARVDGWSHLQTLLRVFVPLSAPGVFTAAILIFIYAWNEFFFALLIMTERQRQTLPVGIALFQGQYTLPWGEIAAASTLATIPLVVLVLLFQRRIISGLSSGALKGS